MSTDEIRTTQWKIAIFMRYFTGRTDVYGTYDHKSGKARQVKEPVTTDVIRAHLRGEQPYGVYLLHGSRTQALAVDFDEDDPLVALEFVTAAGRYDIPAYVERSKSKGYHVWIFFEEGGVSAAKARRVARHLLQEIERPGTEIFPKQDAIDDAKSFGNFINAPLFGALVPEGRTVFIDPNLQPHPNQWDFLESVERVSEDWLDEIIEVNAIEEPNVIEGQTETASEETPQPQAAYGLPICAQRILAEGVRDHQRVACFRLAVQLRKTGLPYELALAVLKAWAPHNRPTEGKRLITEREIAGQAAWAYAKPYRGCGCEEPAIAPYCSPICPLHKKRTCAAPNQAV